MGNNINKIDTNTAADPRIKYGLLHNHTENSLRDSAMSVERLVLQAKKLGAPALALTDHGVMTGYISFMHCCKDNGIKPILGVEFYVEEEHEGRRHLIVMAKNKEGFHALAKAVSATSLRTCNGYPRASKALLKKYFGPGSDGHGNVIATSACAGGVLASIILANQSVESDIETLRTEQETLVSPDSPSYKANLAKMSALETRQKELFIQIAARKKAAAKSTKALLRRAETGKDKIKCQEARAAYEAAEKEKAEAAARLEELNILSEKNAADLKIIKSHIGMTDCLDMEISILNSNIMGWTWKRKYIPSWHGFLISWTFRLWRLMTHISQTVRRILSWPGRSSSLPGSSTRNGMHRSRGTGKCT